MYTSLSEANAVFCCHQTNDAVISTENDDQLMLKAHLSLLENGVGWFRLRFRCLLCSVVKVS